MHSYLFVGESTEKEIIELSKQRSWQIISFECYTVDQVRELKHFLSLSSSKDQLIYLKDMHKASEVAQNALLKTIEEPHKHIFFALSCQTEGTVLETIRSRCEIIKVKQILDAEPRNTFNEFQNKSVGEKLKTITEIKTREDALIFLKNYIVGGSQSIQDNPEIYKTLNRAQTALERIENNANVQIQLTNFVLVHLSMNSE